MKKIYEFKNVGNDIYCREVLIGNITGTNIILSDWYWWINVEYV